jgi:FAD/FMN-containing dehydrogenase
VPVERTADFVEWFLREIPIEPIWLCPLRLRDAGGESGTAVSMSERAWPLYPLEPNRTYVNAGFWSAVPTVAGQPEGAANRAIEQTVTEFDGHKSLYSDSYYGKDEFAALYGGATYTELKKRYDPDQRLLDLYSKAVQRK